MMMPLRCFAHDDRSRSPFPVRNLRLVAAVVLLVIAGINTGYTITRLKQRRQLRIELAEISHVRYGLLDVDRWVEALAPVVDARIDAFTITHADRAALRPVVELALYRLLDQVKETASAKPKPGAPKSFPPQGNAMLANMVAAALRPHVPEYAEVVVTQLTGPQTLKAAKEYLKRVVAASARTTWSHVDTRWRDWVLRRNGCADVASCQRVLGARIAELDARVQVNYGLALGASALAFLVLLTGRSVLRRVETVLLMLFCLVLLAGGVLTPMIDVEARMAHVGLTVLGQPLEFPDQVLYYQSKSVLEVFRTLIDVGRPDMYVVGVLVLMFSVIFPTLKICTLTVGLFRPALLRTNRLLHFLGLGSSKWSMADVMALAIFMTYVAFNGILTSSLEGVRQTGAQLVIPTDGSRILPGYYLFIGFCLASLLLSSKLEHGIATGGLREGATESTAA
jgi:hypothetical protein